VLQKLSALTEWVAPALHDAVNQTATELSLGMGKVAQPIRVAVSGGTVSPPIDVTLEVLGREVTLARLERALGYARGQG
jgi:glutamyl-tRNA synthetase